MNATFRPTVQSFNRKKIVVVGMETHVCVLQTCLDLIKAGFQVHLVADAVASRVNENRNIAIDILNRQLNSQTSKYSSFRESLIYKGLQKCRPGKIEIFSVRP
ncbi:isochorismatase family protein [uncultured Desulfosarcina sp.]|uniref:isochorismatase family protein n=1 Tax=uncultured Desulfosarcina sp. TaxID=218289 RepID=UPI0029C718DB|nr:isochorismatase family protein [uncultured Desulfosarcina sp.]